jgi:hypothetical protein
MDHCSVQHCTAAVEMFFRIESITATSMVFGYSFKHVMRVAAILCYCNVICSSSRCCLRALPPGSEDYQCICRRSQQVTRCPSTSPMNSDEGRVVWW